MVGGGVVGVWVVDVGGLVSGVSVVAVGRRRFARRQDQIELRSI